MAVSRKSARLRFGFEVRRYRKRAGMTQQHVAKALHISQSHLSDVEVGKKGLGTEQIPRLDSVLNAGGLLAKRWQDLHREDGYAEWFRDVVTLEQEATEIRLYQSSVVPGLFQTAAYARELIQLGNPGATSVAVTEQVEARIRRQEILEAEQGAVVMAVIEEHVLRRPVGGVETMAAQLDKLLEVAIPPRVTVQVIPLDTPEHYGMDGSFALFVVPEKGHLAYTETHVSSDPRDDKAAIDGYMTIFGNLRGVALAPSASRSLIERIRREFDAQP
ncbi:transcriptional regulator with XRE-family HTH domain [Lipingzhangella halophila]|uniref:Transcriptional regulator with XRE-family HTH domain n=1 Tax=Lipingzhangella halophila TaxID=1783352 RepID=A0A7W7RHK2_9ACTN|nr:helix-turn-helix transcriptional regulator [Lipingzhangella halophila]MBB4931601.1 transcriptional regulator with XRE-family HTH domain [Lipingzhangella halophila]